MRTLPNFGALAALSMAAAPIESWEARHRPPTARPRVDNKIRTKKKAAKHARKANRKGG